MTAIASFCSLAGVYGFDTDAWQARCGELDKEAMRLKGCYQSCVKNLETPAEDVTVPVDVYDDGAVKSVIYAKKAQYFLKAGLVWAEDVVAKKFKRDGTVDTEIVAKNCVVDRLSKSGWAEGRATVTHGETVFGGEGVYFSSSNGYVKVFKNTTVDSRSLKFGELK